MRSLRDVASRINAGGDLDAVLRDLIHAACEHGGWTLGAIMAIDAAHGDAHVVIRHDPTLLQQTLADRWELATSPALIALKRNEPVYLRDARESEDFPGYRREAFERDYRTVLVLPMSCCDADGRPMVMNVISRQIVEVSADDLAFMGMVVHLGSIAVEREHQLRHERQNADRVRGALRTQTSLLEAVLSGSSTEDLAAMLADRLPDPVVVVDFAANLLVASRSPAPATLDDAAWRDRLDGDEGARIAAAVRDAVTSGQNEVHGLRLGETRGFSNLAASVEALSVDGQAVGGLLIFRQPGIVGSDLERLLLDSVKFALSVQLMRSVIRFRFETRTLTEIFFEMIERRWRDADDLVQRGRRLGLAIGRPMRMIVVDFPDRASLPTHFGADAHDSVTRHVRQLALRASVIAVGGGLVCLVQEESGRERIALLAKRMAEALRQTFRIDPVIVVGGVCEEPKTYPREWERCWRMIRIARSYGRSGVLSAVDFGPMPMLVGAAESGDVRGFVESAVGAVIEHDRTHGTPYFETLDAYLREGCRAQACANAMGLHVTTLRYRLARMEDLFGINPETPDARFAIELAVWLHGLIDAARPTSG
ncbi:helix-turn-helix domain-containing protein [Methylobacterium aquaticum]|uniref:helix-turn-helix domain-containing protein n=1 Tax=Methylobacterium aquaticum TaxID=270351 RepID=UPI003D174815